MRRLRIEVPASSANLGPGFDSLGLALNLVDIVTAEIGGEEIRLETAAGNVDPRDNLICRGYRAWSDDTGTALPGATFSVDQRIPVGKGLGSSAAAIVAGLAAGAFVAKDLDAADRIIRIATEIEGHADNAVPATLGGVTVAFRDAGAVHALNVANHLGLGIALFVPHERLGTDRSRRVLPEIVSFSDAVFNVGRAAYLTTALIWGKWELIGPAMRDRLHQPYRSALIPALDVVIDAAIAAGAYGAALSGGGPSVIALGPEELAADVAAAMQSCAHNANWPGKGIVSGVRHKGVVVVES
jgi:homoserine kinase